MSERREPIRPREFSHALLQALEASEGRRKRRKRDQTPDKIGLDLKRDLLERAQEDDPAPEAFEGWLLAQALSAPASGPVRAMCSAILDEYHAALFDPGFARWLEEGAPSDDTEPATPKSDSEVDPRVSVLNDPDPR
jgi:hypothetical protein